MIRVSVWRPAICSPTLRQRGIKIPLSGECFWTWTSKRVATKLYTHCLRWGASVSEIHYRRRNLGIHRHRQLVPAERALPSIKENGLEDKPTKHHKMKRMDVIHHNTPRTNHIDARNQVAKSQCISPTGCCDFPLFRNPPKALVLAK